MVGAVSVSSAQSPIESHYAGVFQFGVYSLLAKFYHDLLGDYLHTGSSHGSCSSSTDCGSVRRSTHG